MSRPAIAREGALNNLSPALGARAEHGESGRAGFVAAEAVTTKCLGGVRLCSGRLCGRGLPWHFRTPRSARAPSTGLRLLSAPSRATETSSQTAPGSPDALHRPQRHPDYTRAAFRVSRAAGCVRASA